MSNAATPAGRVPLKTRPKTPDKHVPAPQTAWFDPEATPTPTRIFPRPPIYTDQYPANNTATAGPNRNVGTNSLQRPVKPFRTDTSTAIRPLHTQPIGIFGDEGMTDDEWDAAAAN